MREGQYIRVWGFCVLEAGEERSKELSGRIPLIICMGEVERIMHVMMAYFPDLTSTTCLNWNIW